LIVCQMICLPFVMTD